MQKFGMSLVLAYVIILLDMAYGWVENILTIIHSGDSQITAMGILRVVGIFVVPLGAVLGYI